MRNKKIYQKKIYYRHQRQQVFAIFLDFSYSDLMEN